MIEQILSWTALPNLHPAIVHFPIALMPIALTFELARLLLRRQEWLDRATISLYALAALGAMAAIWAGERAADSLVNVPASIQPMIGRHSDWAHYAAWAIGLGALVRLTIAWRRPASNPVGTPIRIGLLVLSLGTLGLLGYAADLGGNLVFGHGLGVATTAEMHPENARERKPIADQNRPPGEQAASSVASRLQQSADGGLHWRPLPGDSAALDEILTAAPGASQGTVTWEQPTAVQGLALAVHGRSLLVFPEKFSDVQVDATLDLDDFEGSVGLAHHVAGIDNGGFFTLSTNGVASLFDVRDGEHKDLDQKTNVEMPAGPVTLTVSAAGRHLKGLLNEHTLTHGHLQPGAAGNVGLQLDGTGSVRIVEVTVTPLQGH